MTRAAASLLVLLVCSSACAEAPRPQPLPAYLIGTWEADAESSYHGAFIRLNNAGVRIGTIEGTLEAYALRTVSRTEGYYAPLFTLVYVDAAQHEHYLQFFYEGQEIRLRNLASIAWKRATT